MTLAERRIYMVCDLDETSTAGLMIVASNLGGQYPKMVPVVGGKDFGKVVEGAIGTANKVLGK